MSNEIQAISQGNYILHNIDAKKLYVQEPLFTANSGDAVYVGWRPDETVLWEGTAFTPAGSNNPMQTSVQLSEDVFNFTKLQLEFSGGQVFRECITILPYTGNDAIYYNYKPELNNPLTYIGTKYKLTDSTTLSGKCSYGRTQNIDTMTGGYWDYGGVCRVIGINRKENA